MDFSPTSRLALGHALRLAIDADAELELVHIQRRENPVPWNARLDLNTLLDNFGVLHPDPALNTDSRFRLRFTTLTGKHPSAALMAYFIDHRPDFLVVPTHARTGVERWFSRAVAVPVARAAGCNALFIPAGVEGFVDMATGALRLRRVVVPFDHTPRPEIALDALAGVVANLKPDILSCTLVHVGAAEKAPRVDLSNRPWTWLTLFRRGEPVYEILKVAAETMADLLVMATAGRESVGDTLRGSTLERVIRDAPCPVLAAPAASSTAS